MLLLTVDRSSSQPVYRQICERLVALMDEGVLQAGDRLPATRSFAETLGVHRSTVLRAYDEIRALGYLESTAGSYTTVRRRARPPATQSPSRRGKESGLIHWESKLAPTVPRVGAPVRSDTPTDMVDFDRLAADPSLAPTEEIRHCLRRALLRHKGTALDYAHASGWTPLRELVATRLRAHGIAVGAHEILITGGAQHGVDLAMRMLVRPGDEVVVEAPTYGMAHALLTLHGARAIEIPMRHDGMDLDALERALRQRRPACLYTMPNFHNPMGITTDQSHRERLLSLCETSRVPILEDGFEEEMKYFGQAVLPIKSMDSRGIVLYIGSFSKVVFPGLRVGWIAAPQEAIECLTAIQHASWLCGNTLSQAAAALFSASGQFEAYLRRVHRVYRRRMRAMLDGLQRHMPEGAHWTRPSGGYTLWLTLPDSSESEEALCQRSRLAGVSIAPGRRYFGKPSPTAHARLSVACVDEERIEEGCRRLGDVLRNAI